MPARETAARLAPDGLVGYGGCSAIRREESEMANAKFVVYKDKADEYRWRLVAPNGKETASSGQHFANHYDAKRAAEEVKEHAATAEVVDE
jgi:uncharacterized protein YegP (UPF0339 family)